MPPVPFLRDSRAIVTRPSIRLARRKGLQLLSSFLYYFSLSSLDRPSMGAEVRRFERFFFFFFNFILSGVLFLFFGTVIFWSFRNL